MSGSSSFGHWLSECRKVRSLSQAQLAERANCAFETIRKIEAGARRPSVDLARALATALAIPPDEWGRFIEFARLGAHVALAGPDEGPAAAPALRPRHIPSNLPAPRTSFVGRVSDMGWVWALLARPEVRLVTLLGAPGIGKTRLGLQVAAGLRDQFPDGVFVVTLAALKDAGMVVPTIAHVLDLKESPDRPLVTLLQEYLRDKTLLLLLDNFEHLMPAAAVIGTLIERCPQLKLLVTSRTTLCVYGEYQFPLAPLAVPDAASDLPLNQLVEYEALDLFTQRAQAVKPLFVLNAKTAPVVAAICRQVDGLPLAIELAAARIKLLPLQELLERLSNRLKTLAISASDLPPRQRSLRAAIAWSYELLTPVEQALFRRLAVFVRGATLEAIAAVCPLPAEPPLDDLELMTSLLDKSLVKRGDRGEGAARFWMLYTIREYAQEQLMAAGEAAAIQQQHAGYYLTLAEAAEPHLRSARRDPWLARLDRDYDNVRAALAWCQANAPPADWGLRLVGALHWFWYFRGYLTEGRQWLEQALERAGSARSTVAGAKALAAAGRLALLQHDYAIMRPRLEESAAIWRAVGDRQELAYTLTSLGVAIVYRQREVAAGGHLLIAEAVALFRDINDQWGLAFALDFLGDSVRLLGGDEDQVRQYKEQSLACYRALDDQWGIALELSELGEAALRARDYATACKLLTEALQMEQAGVDRWTKAHIVQSLGNTLWHQGAYEQATALYEESLAMFRALGNKLQTSAALRFLGQTAQRRGEYAQATTLYRHSLTLAQELGNEQTVALCLAALGGVAVEQGNPVRAARLFGVADALHEANHSVLPPSDSLELQRHLVKLHAMLDEGSRVAAWQQGRRLTLVQAIAYGRGETVDRLPE